LEDLKRGKNDPQNMMHRQVSEQIDSILEIIKRASRYYKNEKRALILSSKLQDNIAAEIGDLNATTQKFGYNPHYANKVNALTRELQLLKMLSQEYYDSPNKEAWRMSGKNPLVVFMANKVLELGDLIYHERNSNISLQDIFNGL